MNVIKRYDINTNGDNILTIQQKLPSSISLQGTQGMLNRNQVWLLM